MIKRILGGIVLGYGLGYVLGFAENDTVFGLLFGTIVALTSIAIFVFASKSWIVPTILISIVVALIVGLSCTPDLSMYVEPSTGRKIPYEIAQNLKRWSMQSVAYRITTDILGVTGTVFSLLIAMNIEKLKKYTQWFAFIAAVSYGIISAFDIGDKANRTRQAWRKLNTAVLRYQEQQDFTMKELIDVYSDAEDIVGDVKSDLR